MAQDNAKRQRRLQKQKAKRKEKRKESLRHASAGYHLQFAHAADWPILEALEAETLWEQGLGHVILARRTPDGRIAWAAFVVDIWCLGIKNAMYAIDSPSGYAEIRRRTVQTQPVRPVAPERLVKIVQGAVAYSGALGFQPNVDYPDAATLFAGIDPAACRDHLEFGKDGKPHYVRGPYESLARAAAIGAKVKAAGGHYIMWLGENESPNGAIAGDPIVYGLPDDDDEDDPGSRG